MKMICAMFLSMLTLTVWAAPQTDDDDSKAGTYMATVPVRKTTADRPQVTVQTSVGDIVLELDAKAAPKTVANFLKLVDAGFYNKTLFHRVIRDFMIQGGGFQAGMAEKTASATVANESHNGLKNMRGTIAMARKQDPDSASTQFFINLVDNNYLNATDTKLGYTVFGRVIRGMEVVDQIAQVPTGQQGYYSDVPKIEVSIISAKRLP